MTWKNSAEVGVWATVIECSSKRQNEKSKTCVGVKHLKIFNILQSRFRKN